MFTREAVRLKSPDLRQSRRLDGCGPLKGACSQPKTNKTLNDLPLMSFTRGLSTFILANGLTQASSWIPGCVPLARDDDFLEIMFLELSNCGSPPSEPGVYLGQMKKAPVNCQKVHCLHVLSVGKRTPKGMSQISVRSAHVSHDVQNSAPVQHLSHRTFVQYHRAQVLSPPWSPGSHCRNLHFAKQLSH
jgi:hypothetical protein